MSASIVGWVVATVIFVCLLIGGVFMTPPIGIANVRNGDLVFRHYYDYRKGARALTYFAQMEGGKPNGKLYAVELRGESGYSRRPIVQFSVAGVTDFNPGTLVTTVTADSNEASPYYQSFTEVRGKYERQKWWERVFSQ